MYLFSEGIVGFIFCCVWKLKGNELYILNLVMRKDDFGTCADSEDPDQPIHPRGLIMTFAVRLQNYYLSMFLKRLSRTSVARTTLEPWKLVWHMGSSSHWGLLIVLGFNDTSTLEGHFVSSPREREKRDRRESRGDEREGQGRKRNRNESEETEEIKTFPLYSYPLQG